MTKLACSAFNCVNNVDAICTAAVIDINGENVNSKEGTECETFAPRTLGNAVKNVFNSNYLGVIAKAFDSDHNVGHSIRCTVSKCYYNLDNTCTSDYIQVYGPNANTSTETECETFKVK